jgi:hypothetical protein
MGNKTYLNGYEVRVGDHFEDQLEYAPYHYSRFEVLRVKYGSLEVVWHENEWVPDVRGTKRQYNMSAFFNTNFKPSPLHQIKRILEKYTIDSSVSPESGG